MFTHRKNYLKWISLLVTNLFVMPAFAANYVYSNQDVGHVRAKFANYVQRQMVSHHRSSSPGEVHRFVNATFSSANRTGFAQRNHYLIRVSNVVVSNRQRQEGCFATHSQRSVMACLGERFISGQIDNVRTPLDANRLIPISLGVQSEEVYLAAAKRGAAEFTIPAAAGVDTPTRLGCAPSNPGCNKGAANTTNTTVQAINNGLNKVNTGANNTVTSAQVAAFNSIVAPPQPTGGTTTGGTATGGTAVGGTATGGTATGGTATGGTATGGTTGGGSILSDTGSAATALAALGGIINTDTELTAIRGNLQSAGGPTGTEDAVTPAVPSVAAGVVGNINTLLTY